MTRLILDEGVPRLLARRLQALGVDASEFPNEWKQLSDAELIVEVERGGFEIMITCDRNMPFQRPLKDSRLRILVLPQSRLHDLLDEAAAITARLRTLEKGRYAFVGRDGSLPLNPTKPLGR